MVESLRKLVNLYYNKNQFIILTGFIVLLALALRLYRISDNPPAIFVDEASMGYNSYQLLKTGRDEFGVSHPILFKSLGDYRLGLPVYLNIPAIAVFGLSEFSIRLTGVIIGVIGIIFLILITKEIYNERAALLVGLLTAICPWHIHFSRWGIECIYFPTMLSIAVYFFIKSLKKCLYLPISSFFFGLTIYTYFASLVIIPIVVIIAVIIWIFKKGRKDFGYLILSLLVIFIVSLPIFIGLTNGALLSRWKSINTTKTTLENRITHGIKIYIDNVSLNFLFLKGDIDMPGHFVSRHSVRGIGELYLFQLPLLIIGLFFVIFKKRTLGNMFMLALLLIFPLGSVVGNDTAMATRSITGILPLSFFSGVGFDKVLDLIKLIKNNILRMFTYLFISLVIVSSVLIYLILFFRDYPMYSSDYWGWQYGFRPAMTYFKTQENNYDQLLVTHRFNGTEGLFQFYNVEFKCQKCKVMTNPITIDIEKHQLFALRKDDIEEAKRLYPKLTFFIKKIIYLPNGSPEIFLGVFN